MARTRRVYRLKKNLIPTLDAEATNSPPSNQPQPPAGEASPEKNDSPARGTNSPPSNQPQPPAGEADSPSRGGFKTPPRRDSTNDALSEVPTSEHPASPPEERSFPSKEGSPCATKACRFNGTVYQFYHRAQKNANRERFYCLDCINKFRAQSRARKKRSFAKSKKAKDFKKACQILGLPEVVQTGLINSVFIDDREKQKLFDHDKHFAFVFSIEFSYQLLSSTQRLCRIGTWEPLCAPKAARDQKFGLYKSWGLDGDNDWKKSLRKALKVDKDGVDCDGQYSVLVGFVEWIQNFMDMSDDRFFVKLSLIKTVKDVQQVRLCTNLHLYLWNATNFFCS